MKNPVNWFEIYVQDLHRARKFYEKVLGVEMEEIIVPDEGQEKEDPVFQMLGFPFVNDEPNASGALVKAEGVESGGNSTMVYFTCDDCSVEEGRVEKAGGKIQKEKFSIGEFGFCSICMDSEGNTFGLHSMN
ncbi:VOC family protein [Aliifodinibius salicampi]|uniref:VOC family protein n=1 Tax=Fodinibius salicampi TaxID=1920655 RepID=A0ABT3Q1I4_9BACT|nr:VOC family protein [Fodinibius salicampi]MCW9713911.1 VOC family protein [Fodinibius salicampi]